MQERHPVGWVRVAAQEPPVVHHDKVVVFATVARKRTHEVHDSLLSVKLTRKECGLGGPHDDSCHCGAIARQKQATARRLSTRLGHLRDVPTSMRRPIVGTADLCVVQHQGNRVVAVVRKLAQVLLF